LRRRRRTTGVRCASLTNTSTQISSSSSTQNATTNCTPPLLFVQGLTFLIRCETCIDRIYTLGPAPCPQCGRMLRKAKFRKQTFEDTLVEREVDVRRRISKLFMLPDDDVDFRFNKRREDFASLRAYNDYLEEVEEISITPQNDFLTGSLQPGKRNRSQRNRNQNLSLRIRQPHLHPNQRRPLRQRTQRSLRTRRNLPPIPRISPSRSPTRSRRRCPRTGTPKGRSDTRLGVLAGVGGEDPCAEQGCCAEEIECAAENGGRTVCGGVDAPVWCGGG
jgi:CDK-activating kinase assembly factor MAT1